MQTSNYVDYVTQQLQSLKNESNAQAMAAYMKTSMPFYGVRATERQAIVKHVVRNYKIQSQQEYLDLVAQLWQQPHREQKYIAMNIARAYPHYIDINTTPLFENMIRQGAWWDFVDEIAVHIIGSMVLHNPNAMWPIIDTWISDSDMWVRRTAIICQNRFKGKTDYNRLFSFCMQRAHEKDFFIRKAIGWALREYAKTEPARVYAFVEKNKTIFSTLSYQQAIKGADKKK